MLLADLKSMAAGMGISGAGSMKKAQLVDAIKAAQSGGPAGSPASAPTGHRAPSSPARRRAARAGDQRPARHPHPASRAPAAAPAAEDRSPPAGAGARSRPPEPQPARPTRPDRRTPAGARPSRSRASSARRRQRTRNQARQQDDAGQDGQQDQARARTRARTRRTRTRRASAARTARTGPGSRRPAGQQAASDQQGKPAGQRPAGQAAARTSASRASSQQGQQPAAARASRASRTSRTRTTTARAAAAATGAAADATASATANRPGNRNEPDTTVLEDDVLVPAAGILDVLDNYAFVRTSGYLPGTDDVYLSLSMVRKFGLRRGDAIVGQVRQPREGERKEKFNPMVRIDSVNGADPEAARDRAEFDSFTPVHPDDRLRLETDSGNLVGRMIDLVGPDRQGPARPGAGAARRRHHHGAAVGRRVDLAQQPRLPPDDRPPRRAARGGHRLPARRSRARSSPRPSTGPRPTTRWSPSWRSSGPSGSSSSATTWSCCSTRSPASAAPTTSRPRPTAGCWPAASTRRRCTRPKQFFGAARNIEQGGSLTILATALVDTGSATDEVILEEFTGTANSVLRLSGDVAGAAYVPRGRRARVRHPPRGPAAHPRGAGDRGEAAALAARPHRRSRRTTTSSDGCARRSPTSSC